MMSREVPTAFAVVMKTIAKAPDNVRRDIIRDAYKEFVNMPLEKRIDSIESMIMAIDRLDDKAREAIVKTRLELFGEYFNENERKDLHAAHIDALFNLPEDVSADELETMFKMIGELDEKYKTVNLDALKKIYEEAPVEKRAKILKLLPEKGKKLLPL